MKKIAVFGKRHRRALNRISQRRRLKQKLQSGLGASTTSSSLLLTVVIKAANRRFVAADLFSYVLTLPSLTLHPYSRLGKI